MIHYLAVSEPYPADGPVRLIHFKETMETLGRKCCGQMVSYNVKSSIMRMFGGLFQPSVAAIFISLGRGYLIWCRQPGEDVDGPAATLGQDLIPRPQLNSNLLFFAGAFHRNAVENARKTWTPSGGQNPGAFIDVLEDTKCCRACIDVCNIGSVTRLGVGDEASILRQACE
jgi:hypothetical protein